MRKNDFKIKTLPIDIPFYECIDGDFELMEELFANYLSRSGNIEKIKKFMIIDYLTNIENNELSKMFSNFKTRKLAEKEAILRRERVDYSEADDLPF